MMPPKITEEQKEAVDAYCKELADFLNRDDGYDWNTKSTALLVTLASAMADRSPNRQVLEQLIAIARNDIQVQAIDRWNKKAN